MKCPKCEGEMEECELRGDPKWEITLYPKKNTLIFSGDKKINTYRCKNCGFLESYAK